MAIAVVAIRAIRRPPVGQRLEADTALADDGWGVGGTGGAVAVGDPTCACGDPDSNGSSAIKSSRAFA